jgi:hypothetical protein
MPRVDHRLRVPPAISAEVVARYGNDCWLAMPGCTKVGDTSDHIVPHVFGGPTIVKNLRRACRHCNGLRRERILSGWPSVIHAVIGPPCAGKTTWVMEHMKPDDIIVDYDQIAKALMPGMDAGQPVPDAVRELTAGAWQGAYRNAVTLAKPVGLWLGQGAGGPPPQDCGQGAARHPAQSPPVGRVAGLGLRHPCV